LFALILINIIFARKNFIVEQLIKNHLSEEIYLHFEPLSITEHLDSYDILLDDYPIIRIRDTKTFEYGCAWSI